jgi:hypothetical protein
MTDGPPRMLDDPATPPSLRRDLEARARVSLALDLGAAAARLDRARADADDARRSRARWWAWLAPAAAVAVVALVWWRVPRPSPAPTQEPPSVAGSARPEAPATATESRPPRRPGESAHAAIDRVEGTVVIIDGGAKLAARAGQALADGQTLATVGATSHARLTLGDGTALELGGDSVIAPQQAGARLFVAVGTVWARVMPRPSSAPLSLITPHAEATVLGTALSLSVGAEGTRLRVSEGRVRLARGSQAVEVAAGQQALATERELGRVAAASPSTAMLVVGGTPLVPGDQLLQRRLESLGFEVRIRGSASPIDDEVRHARIVLISSTIESVDVSARYRDLPVPILVSDTDLLDELGMAGLSVDGDTGVETDYPVDVAIKHPSHPLAAGLAGEVRVLSERATIRWARPTAFAAWTATLPHAGSRAVLYGYERGARMYGLSAPARRVGFFLHDATATVLNDNGWALFDAAVRWCADDAAAR